MKSSSVRLQSSGTYELVRKLGTGGMAEVHLGYQRMAVGVERPVVVKSILPHLADDHEFVEMFLREARIATGLSHPNIVRIYDVSNIDSRPCIIMEFLRGRDLAFLLKRVSKNNERIPPDVTATIIAQVATGLDYAHRTRDSKGRPMGLVHRDVSPQNVFLTREGHVRILDFGIAKTNNHQGLTQTGTLKGKLSYMSPEQVGGETLDGRSDEFALGIVFWEALTGKRLFARPDPVATIHAVMQCDVPPPSSIARDVPPDLERIVMKALSKQADDRFESCEKLASEIRMCLHQRNLASEEQLLSGYLMQAVPLQEDDELYGTDILRGRRDASIADQTAQTQTDVEADQDSNTSQRYRRRMSIRPLTNPTMRAKTPTQPRLSSRMRRILSLIALAAVAEVATLAVLQVWPGKDAKTTAETAQGAQTAATAAPTPSTPVPALLQIALSNVPDGAHIHVDGVETPGPTFTLPKDNRQHEIKVMVADQLYWSRTLTLNEDTKLALPAPQNAADADHIQAGTLQMRTDLDFSKPATEVEPQPAPTGEKPAADATPSVAAEATKPSDPVKMAVKRVPKRRPTPAADASKPSTTQPAAANASAPPAKEERGKQKLGGELDLAYP